MIAFTFLHLFCLPLVASYDGMEYVHLANILGTPAFDASWNFLRTPLYPAMLKLAFATGGEQPQIALLVSGAFGLAGVLLAGSTARYVAGDIAGGCALLLLAFYPTLIGYQHMLLTETGIFFFLALLVSLTIRSPRHPIAIAIALALTLTAGYYWRPTLLYLSPVVALTCFWLHRRAASALIVLLAPALLAAPWIHLSSQHPSDLLEVVTTGMYKQVLVQPGDPIFGALGPAYRKIVDQEASPRLPIDGLSILGEGRHAFLKQLHKAYVRAGVAQLIFHHPGRYLKAVIRSFFYFLGVPDHRGDDENWQFSRFVFLSWPPSQEFTNVPLWIPALDTQFPSIQYRGGAALGSVLLALLRAYDFLVLPASAISALWLVLAIRQGNATAFALTAIPLALIVLHALTMMSAARYAFPIYPLMLANLITVLALACRGWAGKRRLT